MLLGGKQANIRQVAVLTRSEKFNQLMNRILADWRYFPVEELSAAEVILAERGLSLPSHQGVVVWLSTMPLAEERFLTVPISLTSLYHLLEEHFYPVPRRHIRVAMDTTVDLQVEGSWQEGRLVSLSDRGGRLSCPSEISRGRQLLLEMKLYRKTIRISAEVLYCIPSGDAPGRQEPQVGVIFKPSDVDEIDRLRCFVEKTCIDSACTKEDLSTSDPCLGWLDVPQDPWGE